MRKIIRDGKFAVLAQKQNRKKMPIGKVKFIQPKLDGVRCIAFLDEDNIVRLYSRNGKEFKNVLHLQTELVGFFANNPHFVLDGELYNHQFKDDFNQIISMVRKTKPTEEHRGEAAEHVQFHVYDAYDMENPLWDYRGRMKYVHVELFNWLPDDPMVRWVHTMTVSQEKDIEFWYARFIEDGYEGAMLRADVDYAVGKRSHFLQKYKSFVDDEFEIVGYVEGKGKLEGHIGKFICKLPDGREFGAPPGGWTYARRKSEFANVDSYIGKIATVEFFELTPAGVPRFPILKGVRDYE